MKQNGNTERRNFGTLLRRKNYGKNKNMNKYNNLPALSFLNCMWSKQKL